ncbi:C40 family peptidase [Dactylosporangium sp. NPDC049742]|uniref:C40 family peptidase n=1 Tax=Dactylosporangium sp. NPDC049742 TaxID=3154737 RepID=UPI00341504F6
MRINLGTALCMVLCGVAGSAPAHGAPADTSPATLISTTMPPVGVRSIWYYEGGTTDARAELREVRAASRDAQRARLAQQAAADAAAGAEATARAEAVTVAGAVTRQRPASRSRPAPRTRASAVPRTGPGRQRPPVTRAPRAAAASTWAPPAPTWVPGAGGGVVGFALAQVGKGYGFGSAGPDRFDCSGLVAAAFQRIGISLPHQTGGLARVGRPVGRGELRPGDLVFPASGHVGIYVGGGRMVHASTERGGVKLSPIYAFSFARRVA